MSKVKYLQAFIFICLNILGGSCSFFDGESPVVTISSPSDNSAVGTIFLLEGTAGDNIGIRQVSYSLDGGDYVTVEGTEVWFKTLSVSSTGTHIITVQAEDYNGNLGHALITVTVSS